jgi:hypothetical protein
MKELPFDPYDIFGYISSGVLFIVGMEQVLGFPQIVGQDLKIVDLAVLILAVYVAGHLMATPAKALFEDVLVGHILSRPNVNLFRDKAPWLGRLLFPGYYKAFPQKTRERMVRDESGEDLFFRVRYSSKIKDDEKIMAKLNGWTNKYGFTRNLAFTSLLVGIALIVKQQSPGEEDLTKYGITGVVVGVLLFYRYLKFYRQYSYDMFLSYWGG